MEYEIELEFDKIIDKAVKHGSLKDYLESVETYGGQEFISHSQATRLYNKYHFDCESWLDFFEVETGLKPWDVFEKWDISEKRDCAINSKNNKYIVITEMFKEYCHDMLEMLLTLEKINKL